jgi:thiol-disulfide isomerase/thioredoxin
MSGLKRDEPETETPFSSATFDVLWGLVAFVAVMVVSHVTRQHQDIRLFLLATCLAFFGAAFYRAGTRAKGLLPTAFLVACGGILPALSMNRVTRALTAPHYLALFMLTSLVAAGLGVSLRSLRRRGKPQVALVIGCFSMLAVLAVVKAIPNWMDSQAYRKVDEEIAPFRIQTLTGKSLTSEQLRGRVVVLSYWATWCTPCQGELSEIEAVQERYRGNPSVLVFALDSGTGGDTSAKAQEYVERRKLTVSAAIDALNETDGTSPGSAARSLGMTILPAIYVLDRSGKLRVVHVGYDAAEYLKESLSRQIDQLL